MKCPSGHENPGGSVQCEVCGATIEYPKAPKATSPSASMTPPAESSGQDPQPSVTTASAQTSVAAAPPTGGRKAKNAKRVGTIATIVETAMWVLAVLSVVGGLVIAFQKDRQCDFLEGCTFVDRYPLFTFGLGVALGSVLWCMTIIMVAAYVGARADGSIK